jgi:hypothetical protein
MPAKKGTTMPDDTEFFNRIQINVALFTNFSAFSSSDVQVHAASAVWHRFLLHAITSAGLLGIARGNIFEISSTTNHTMMPAAASYFRSNLIIVLGIVIVVLLVGNVSLFRIASLVNIALRWWPLIIIVSGLLTFVKGRSRDFNRALFLTVTGVVLQVIMLGYVPANLLALWPLFSLLLGLWLLAVQPKNTVRTAVLSTSTPVYHAVLQGTQLTVTSAQLRSVRLSARFAMLECDFSGCVTATDELHISLHIFGGAVTLSIPESWHASTDVSLTLGVFRDAREAGNPPLLPETPRLRITAAIVAGTLTLHERS